MVVQAMITAVPMPDSTTADPANGVAYFHQPSIVSAMHAATIVLRTTYGNSSMPGLTTFVTAVCGGDESGQPGHRAVAVCGPQHDCGGVHRAHNARLVEIRDAVRGVGGRAVGHRYSGDHRLHDHRLLVRRRIDPARVAVDARRCIG